MLNHPLYLKRLNDTELHLNIWYLINYELLLMRFNIFIISTLSIWIVFLFSCSHQTETTIKVQKRASKPHERTIWIKKQDKTEKETCIWFEPKFAVLNSENDHIIYFECDQNSEKRMCKVKPCQIPMNKADSNIRNLSYEQIAALINQINETN